MRRPLAVVLAALALVIGVTAACSRAKPQSTGPLETNATRTLPATGAAASSRQTPSAQAPGAVPDIAPTSTPASFATPLPIPATGGGLSPSQPNAQLSGQEAPSLSDAPVDASGAKTITIQSGDTLLALANRYNSTVDELLRLNGLAATSILSIGQQLRVPLVAVTHVVQQGETLVKIAARYGVTWQEVAQANGLSDPNSLRLGQRLHIPDPQTAGVATAVIPARSGRVHTVLGGDTLYSIAMRYAVTVQALAQANGITVSSVIFAGQKLTVP